MGVRNLTQQDDYECNGDSTCKQAQKTFAYDAHGNMLNMPVRFSSLAS